LVNLDRRKERVPLSSGWPELGREKNPGINPGKKGAKARLYSSLTSWEENLKKEGTGTTR